MASRTAPWPPPRLVTCAAPASTRESASATAIGYPTLRIIASKYGTTVDAILVLNPNIKNPDLILVGQVIVVR